jgi:hypothetical protein
MAKHELATIEHPKILSFGCSTGKGGATISKYSDFNFLETNQMANYQIGRFDKNQYIRQ